MPKTYMLPTTPCADERHQRSKQRDLVCSWIRRLNIVQRLVLFKLTDFLQFFPESPQRFSFDTDKIILICIWRGKRTRIHLPDFKAYSATMIKSV